MHNFSYIKTCKPFISPKLRRLSSKANMDTIKSSKRQDFIKVLLTNDQLVKRPINFKDVQFKIVQSTKSGIKCCLVSDQRTELSGMCVQLARGNLYV